MDTIKLIKELNKQEKVTTRKNKVRYTNVPSKKLLSKKMTKRKDYAPLLAAGYRNFAQDTCVKVLMKKGKIDTNDFCALILENKKFLKANLYALETVGEHERDLFFFTFGALYAAGVKPLFDGDNEKAVNKYLKIFGKIEKDKIKKFKKIVDSKTIARALALSSVDVNVKHILKNRAIKSFIRILGNVEDADFTTKDLKKLFKIAGYSEKEVVNALLFTKNDNEVITEYLIDSLNKMKKDKLRDTLKAYYKLRTQHPKWNRRVNFNKVEEGRIPEIIDKFVKNDVKKELFN